MKGSKIKTIVKKIDVFATSEMLRYKQEAEYATMTGTILTVVIIGLIGTLAYQSLIGTFTRSNIEWELEISKQIYPNNVTLTMKDFNFGIWISGVDLSDNSLTYFEIYAEYIADYQYIRIPLEPCKSENWNQTQSINQVFMERGGQAWLCPNPEFQMTLGGRWTAEHQFYLQIKVLPCGAIEATNCVPPDELSTFLLDYDDEIPVMVMTVNSLIEPGNPQPISYFVEDTHYAYFGMDNVQKLQLQIAEYTVQTDNSLLPIDSIETKNGLIIESKDRIFPASSYAHYYAWITIKKSPTMYHYKRTYTKIDETVSYIGGLIGVLVGVLFVMAPYTQFCYQLSLANQILADDEGKPVSASINPLRFLIYCGYLVVNFCCSFSCEQYAYYDRCSDEMQKQLDIAYLLKRINTLQRVITDGIDQSLLKFKRISFSESERKASIAEEISSKGQEQIVSRDDYCFQPQQECEKKKDTFHVEVHPVVFRGRQQTNINESQHALQSLQVEHSHAGTPVSSEREEGFRSIIASEAASRRLMRRTRLQSRNKQKTASEDADRFPTGPIKRTNNFMADSRFRDEDY